MLLNVKVKLVIKSLHKCIYCRIITKQLVGPHFEINDYIEINNLAKEVTFDFLSKYNTHITLYYIILY